MERKEFEQITFKNKQFYSDELENAVLTDCIFYECKISGLSLKNTRFHGVQFNYCKIEGVSFTQLNRLVLDMNFNECLIRSSNFTDLDIKKTKFIKCTITDSDFINTILKEADFSSSDLKGSVFHNADLREAFFENAVNYNINPAVNRIKKAVFSLPEALNLLSHLDIIIR